MSTGRTLNPSSSSTTVIYSALMSSSLNAVLTLPPLLLSLSLALRSPAFRSATGPSSRTALVVMPALFVWGLSAELNVIGLKREEGLLRSRELDVSGKRADEVGSLENFASPVVITPASTSSSSSSLGPSSALYKATVGVAPFRVVTSEDELPVHYKVMNMLYDHPFRLLCACGLPIVAGVYSTQKDYAHLKFSQKVMQTRVLGQFTALSLLLGLMGWNAYMDSYGRFVTEKEAKGMEKEVLSARERMLKHIDDENWRADRMRESSRRARMDKMEREKAKKDALTITTATTAASS